MNISKKNKKIEAALRMKELEIIPEIITSFIDNDKIMISEPPFGALYKINEEQEKIVEEFEKEYDSLVYMIIRSYTDFGVMDSLLYISDYEEEWAMEREDIEEGCIMSYTVNYTYPEFSEFGSIGVEKIGGGLVRIY